MGSGRVTTHFGLAWDSRIQFEFHGIVHSKNWCGTVGNDSRQTKNQSTDEGVRILELEEKMKARATAKYVHGACYIFR
jgi:hypothetical protein